MSSPEVSFVIGTFNSEDHIEACLESVYAQKYNGDFEVIVVDNDSDDSTVDIVRENFPEVKLIILPHSNYGLCEMYNIGFSSAEGEFIAKLDDDVEVDENWITTILEEFESEDIGAVNPKIRERDGSVLFDEKGFAQHYKGCSAVFTREMFEDIGYFDEDFFIAREDHEFSYRLISNDYSIKNAPEALTIHKSDNIPSSSNFSERWFRYNTRNLLWITWKYHDSYNAFWNTLWRSSRRFLIAVKKGVLWSWIMATFQAIRRFPKYGIKERNPDSSLEYEYRRWTLKEIVNSLKNLKNHII